MKVKITAIFTLLVAALLLSGCSGQLPVNNWPGLSASDNMAYLASGQHVYAVNLNTHAEAWRFPEKAQNSTSFFATPILTADGQLIVGSAGTDHTLYSIDAATGAQKWTAVAGKPWFGEVLATADAIYAPNSDGNLYAFDPATGKELWKFPTGGSLWSQPASDGERVYFGSLDHYLYALDAKTGREAWKTEFEGAIAGAPVVGPDGLVYAVSFSNAVKALDPATGSVKWTAETHNWVWNAPSLRADVLYFGDLDGNLYALDAATGSQVWTPQQPDGAVIARPLIVDSAVIFAGESGKISALDINGAPLWSYTADKAKFYTSPVRGGDFILIAPMQSDFSLIALTLQGAESWTFTPAK